jgi:hypothetical protein
MHDNPHPASLDQKTLLSQCDERRLRRSGPGGQHRNKVETAVILRHRETDIEAEANERRSVAENRRVAIKRLRLRLALTIRRPVETESTSTLWSERCNNGRLAVNVDHADFPTLLAEALDVLVMFSFDIKLAANRLDLTSSQLVGLLKKEPRAFQLLNTKRESLGLKRLR